MSASAEQEKAAAAAKALELVRPGMKLGLGTGSTAEHFVRGLGVRVRSGLSITGVATSKRTEALARRHGIAVSDLDIVGRLDLTVDGADEIDGELRLIKGGGGALLREKIVAAASDAMVVIADSSKLVASLGAFPLPVEIVPFGHRCTEALVGDIARRFVDGDAPVKLRLDGQGEPFLTDGGHYIVDVACGRIRNAEGLAASLGMTPGVVDHGLFIGLASMAIIGRGGGVEIIEAGADAGARHG
ncbi:MAG TPA: ribose-5-phosphate isomerase RpiA [Candidatus Cybelea sp.]|nr:ribose-5-phosphate isomerase RpiA [Candidatus Cybelea sp.]